MKLPNQKTNIAGYFAETKYPSILNRALTPNMISGSLRWKGMQPAGLRDEFTHLDIGCGDGIGLCLIAAAFPQAKFVGFDAMREHIDTGQEFARVHGIRNIELICQTFEQFLSAPATEIDAFDYITSQGVIAWVSERNRQYVYDIIGEFLAETGASTLGYNCQPGWQNKMSSQQIFLRFLGQQEDKSPEALAAVVDFIDAISGTGSRSVPPVAVEIIRELTEDMPHEYMLHEYLNQYWQPLWFGDVCTELQDRGVSFATHSGFKRLRDDFALRIKQRELLEGIDDPLQRQTTMDILQNFQFRTDIFTKKMPANETESLRNEIWLMANNSIEHTEFNCLTPAGRLTFDNPSTRDILSQLEQGPKQYQSLCKASTHSSADVLNAVETLLVANCIQPVSEPLETNPAEQLNRFLIDYSQGNEQSNEQSFISGIVSKHGALGINTVDFSLLSGKNGAAGYNSLLLRLGI